MTIEIAINSYQRHRGTLTPMAVNYGMMLAKPILGHGKMKSSTGTLTKASMMAEITDVNNTVNSDNEWGFPPHMIDHGPNMGLIMDLAA